ncbi:MAG: IPExxxVDY family protein [Flammeovirgaceae bacterium]
MKKKRLEFDYSYDFRLLGIICASKGYKLAWEINQTLQLQLKREEDLLITDSKNNTFQFTHFEHTSESLVVRVFKNKSTDGNPQITRIVPEFAHYDYIMMVQSGDETKSNRLQELLRTIPSVELVAFIPLAALKSKDNFIF